MIEYFVRPMSGIRSQVGLDDWKDFSKVNHTGFRRKPAGVVEGALRQGSLNLLADCSTAASVAGGPFKFKVTSPYMLSRPLLDRHYRDFEELTIAIAGLLAEQMHSAPCSCLQVDDASIPGNPKGGPLAAAAIDAILDKVSVQRAVHLCFGNYCGQTIQKGDWQLLVHFLNLLHVDHLVMEFARRPIRELEALKGVKPEIKLGLGVIDVKDNQVETADDIARRLDRAEKILGPGRIGWVHPDCGFWMLKRSIADRKIEALVKGRDQYPNPSVMGPGGSAGGTPGESAGNLG
jgi:5-methyltetrahydropteroyltriglutamate--homocysteine methyltransferase